MTSSGALEGLSACECPVCFLTLSGDSNVPMSMPCGHTLCSTCINQLVAKATATSSQLGSRRVPTFQCPLCRDWVNRDAVHLNVTLRDLLVELSRIDKGPSGVRLLPTQHVNHADIQFGDAIDRGAYGEVFRGVWQGNDVAIKVFSSGLLTSDGMASFQREVFVMNCLRHPNVVLLLGACQTPPKLSIIMEYVAGGSLHKLVHIHKVSLSVKDTSSIGLGVCRGLQYLHSINILHRDLKSKNVLLTGSPPSGTAKLCDFGLARMRMESATMTGNVGTVHWSAPEVLSNQRYKFSADVYGLGMVLYEMETGCVPFHNMLPVAVLMAVVIEKRQPEMPSSADPQIVEVIKSCIKWKAEERCSVSSVITKLMDLLPKPHQNESTRPALQHQDSLGVVFVSVTDSNDLADGNSNLADIAKHLGLLDDNSQQQAKAEGRVKGVDFILAQQLQEREEEAQLARDRELAEQLQMTDFSYRTPSDEVPVTVTPPPQVLNSIRTAKKHKQSLKTGNKAPPFTRQAPPLKQVITPVQLVRKSGNHVDLASGSQPVAPPPPPPPPPPLPVVTKLQKAKSDGGSIPPPPPLPQVVAQPQMQRSISQIGRQRRMVEQIRTSGRKMVSKLRPVETIEKSAFRVGRVVDGHSNELSEFTVQNQVKYFNRQRLTHVDVTEPPPAYPVGRVLPPKRGQKVEMVKKVFQRMKKPSPSAARKQVAADWKTTPIVKKNTFAANKSMLATKKITPTARKTTPTLRLHPAIQYEIASFPYDSLEQVETKVKLTLPSKEVIEWEKAEMAEALEIQQNTKTTPLAKKIVSKSHVSVKKKSKMKSKKK